MKLLYVDGDPDALGKFSRMSAKLENVESLTLFSKADRALEYALRNPLDVAFLDMQLSETDETELASRLPKFNPNLRVVFLSQDGQGALKAFQIGAIGYILKPCRLAQIRHELDKAAQFCDLPRHQVFIKTMPNFEVYIDDRLFPIGRGKAKELLALLVDKNGGSLTSGQAIACLWEERDDDERTHSLYRVTYKRLMEILTAGGIEDILGTAGTQKYIKPARLTCDYYRLLAGDPEAAKAYHGEYMSEYEWAWETNERIAEMLGMKSED